MGWFSYAHGDPRNWQLVHCPRPRLYGWGLSVMRLPVRVIKRIIPIVAFFVVGSGIATRADTVAPRRAVVVVHGLAWPAARLV